MRRFQRPGKPRLGRLSGTRASVRSGRSAPNRRTPVRDGRSSARRLHAACDREHLSVPGFAGNDDPGNARSLHRLHARERRRGGDARNLLREREQGLVCAEAGGELRPNWQARQGNADRETDGGNPGNIHPTGEYRVIARAGRDTVDPIGIGSLGWPRQGRRCRRQNHLSAFEKFCAEPAKRGYALKRVDVVRAC